MYKPPPPPPLPDQLPGFSLPENLDLAERLLCGLSFRDAGLPGLLVHGWDSIKILKLYSLLGLSTLKNVKCYPTTTKALEASRAGTGAAGAAGAAGGQGGHGHGALGTGGHQWQVLPGIPELLRFLLSASGDDGSHVAAVALDLLRSRVHLSPSSAGIPPAPAHVRLRLRGGDAEVPLGRGRCGTQMLGLNIEDSAQGLHIRTFQNRHGHVQLLLHLPQHTVNPKLLLHCLVVVHHQLKHPLALRALLLVHQQVLQGLLGQVTEPSLNLEPLQTGYSNSNFGCCF